MTTSFEVEGVVAGVKVGEFVEEVEGVFRVEFGVCGERKMREDVEMSSRVRWRG